MKCRKPFSPKTANSSPNKIRAINTAIFIVSFLYRAQDGLRRLRPHQLQRRLQECFAVYRAHHDLSCAACGDELHVCNANKAKDRSQVWLNEVHCAGWCAQLIDTAARHQNGRLFALQQPLNAALTVRERLSVASYLVDPELQDRWDAEVVHRHANDVFVSLLQLADQLVGERESLLLLRSAPRLRRVGPADPLRVQRLRRMRRQVPGDHSAIRMGGLPCLDELARQLAADRAFQRT